LEVPVEEQSEPGGDGATSSKITFVGRRGYNHTHTYKKKKKKSLEFL